MSVGPRPALQREDLQPDLLARVLDPYLPGRRYLQSAAVEWAPGARLPPAAGGDLARALGRFEAGPAWYIADTGHFNSIEFNLCFNQLGYALLAWCVGAPDGPVEALRAMSREHYFAHQLSGVLIGAITMRFHKPMRSESFAGGVSIASATRGSRAIRVQMRAWFGEPGAPCSEGDISVFLLHPEPPLPAPAP